MPPTGTITRASAAITRPASRATSVTTVLAATPPVAANPGLGIPAPRRPATCPAMIIIAINQPAGPSRLGRWNKTRRRCAGRDQLHCGACGGDDEFPSETQPLPIGDRSCHRDQQQRYAYPAPARHGQRGCRHRGDGGRCRPDAARDQIVLPEDRDHRRRIHGLTRKTKPLSERYQPQRQGQPHPPRAHEFRRPSCRRRLAVGGSR